MYKPCCLQKKDRVDHRILQKSILKKFKGKTIAMIGDSLMRQWFETLTCFLALSGPHWVTSLPSELKALGLQDMHAPPQGMKSAVGYSESTGSLHLKYYHYEKGMHIMNVLNFTRARKYVSIVNIGIHHRPFSNELVDDIIYAVKGCDDNCVFSETFPQHYLHHSYYIQNSTKSCGPMLNKSSAFKSYNKYLHMYVPKKLTVLQTFEPLSKFWKFHFPRDKDCSHFCSDSFIWHEIHKTLLDIDFIATGCSSPSCVDRVPSPDIVQHQIQLIEKIVALVGSLRLFLFVVLVLCIVIPDKLRQRWSTSACEHRRAQQQRSCGSGHSRRAGDDTL